MKVSKKAALPSGFAASGISCGIKKSGRPDLALIYSKPPAKACGMFTGNKIPAAPVIFCKRLIKKAASFRAIIANSGNANCFNGKAGLKDAQDTASCLADNLMVPKGSVLVASTGIIGKKLPLPKVKEGIPKLVAALSAQGMEDAARAIMTTDTFAKAVSVKLGIGGKVVTLCGIAKGAGMISPDMATLLVFIATDADISAAALKGSLKCAVDKSFNSITIDGCMSTNDSVIILANGAAANARITAGKGLKLFMQALNALCLELAKMIVRDAEGASKFIEIRVAKAKDPVQAKKAALAVANSDLFKTAVYGENPNFGRIAAAVGSSGVEVDEEGLKVRVSSLKKRDIAVNILLNKGNASAVVYTSDLTPEYIKINAEYN
jgi:glutamate N-acetyltransferase/amino-acid N-acetyltransferase